MTPPRPGAVCRGLLAALDASEGRRRRRKRDTTPDAIGMTLKRHLLTRAVAEDPDPEMFEAWLLQQCLAPAESSAVGGMRAMATEVLADWRLADTMTDFRAWLERGAPSEDRA